MIRKMRTGTRKAILFAILFGVVAYAIFDTIEEQVPAGAASAVSKKSERSQEAAATTQGDAGAEARAGRFALPERPPLGEPRADLFGSNSWQPPPPKVVAAPPPKPVAPPVPYRFAGQLIQGERPGFPAKGTPSFQSEREIRWTSVPRRVTGDADYALYLPSSKPDIPVLA